MNKTFSLVHPEVDENLQLTQEVILGQWRLVIKAQLLIFEQEREEWGDLFPLWVLEEMHRLKILKILFLHSNILEHFSEKQNTPAAEQNAAAQECSHKLMFS